ncbi:MAG: zf-TFIIB domain-containing protein [Acidimicrobiia bacterium]
MNCPTCPEAILVIADRSGIEIDYCPTCRGVWLDRGELDKLIERAAAASPPRSARDFDRDPPGDRRPARRDRDDDDDGDRRSSGGYDDGRRKRRRSVLDDLFDF